MIDQIQHLLLNRSGVPGLRRVSDPPSDAVMALFGLPSGADETDDDIVARLVQLALAPDLSRFRRFYDQRVTPRAATSVYRQPEAALSPEGLYDKVLGREGWWSVNRLFQHADPGVYAVLSEMRSAAASGDAPYALGAVLLAVAYRRWLLQGGGD